MKNYNKPKPDNRSDNARKIRENIKNAEKNIELAEEMISYTDNPKNREQLMDKNNRRQRAIKGLQEELKEEEQFER